MHRRLVDSISAVRLCILIYVDLATQKRNEFLITLRVFYKISTVEKGYIYLYIYPSSYLLIYKKLYFLNLFLLIIKHLDYHFPVRTRKMTWFLIGKRMRKRRRRGGRGGYPILIYSFHSGKISSIQEGKEKGR